MRSLVWLVLVVEACGVPPGVRAAESASTQDGAVLDAALVVAGRHLYGHLPLTLVSELPSMVSPGAEAWTVFDEQGRSTRAFVYTQSRTFRCASVPGPDQPRCRLKLASVIVHEAWHLKNGRDEAGAYDAQLIFLQLIEASGTLQLNQAAAVNINEVRRAKARALRAPAGMNSPSANAEAPGWPGALSAQTGSMEATSNAASRDASAATDSRLDAARMARVRSVAPMIQAAITRGTERSPTFRRLIETIGNSDGIVYVLEGDCGFSVRACLQLRVVVAGANRFLRIRVSARQAPGCELVASIGHELQHAIEVLSNPQIRDFNGMFHFFDRNGRTSHGTFETAAAQEVGRAIARETC